MYLSSEVTRCPHDTIVALMSFLSTCNLCVTMIWPVSINLPSVFSSFGIGASNVSVTDDFPNHFRFRRIHVGWVANHHRRLGRHIASSAVAVNLYLEHVFFWVQVEALQEFPSMPLLSAFRGLDVVPELVRVFQNPFPRQNSSSSLERRSFHVDCIVLQIDSANWSALKQHMFRPLQGFVRWCISSPSATTDPSVRQFGCTHFVIGNQRKYRFTKHARRWHIWSSKQILEWGSAVGSHHPWENKSSVTNCKWNDNWNCWKLYVSVRLNLCLVASCQSLYVSVHCFDKPVALMTCFWRKS